MRHRTLAAFACAIVVLALMEVPASAQRGLYNRSGPIFVTSPLLFTWAYHPYYLGFGQWYPYPYPYPVLGFPPAPGFFVGDHFSSVRIQIPQRDALVYVDGYAAGIVDDFDGVFQRLQLVPGHHEIVVYLQGHRILRQGLYLNPGSTHTIRHTMLPLAPGEAAEPQPVPRVLPPMPGPPAPFPPGAGNQQGALALRVQPADASVYIDGEMWRGPEGQDRIVIQLAAGSHRVRVEKTGFQSFDVQIDVRPGETTSFNVSLTQ